MKIKFFFTTLITASLLISYSTVAADLTQQSVSEEAYKSVMGLMDQVVGEENFLRNRKGFPKTYRTKWEQAIDNLAAYLKKTKSLLISQANIALFNDSIKELKSSTEALFAAARAFVPRGQALVPSELACEMDKLAARMPNINALLDKLATTKSTDFKGTKDLKTLFFNVLDAWKQLYIKAYGKMHSALAAIEKDQNFQKAHPELIVCYGMPLEDE